jgi:hypothetical protein
MSMKSFDRVNAARSAAGGPDIPAVARLDLFAAKVPKHVADAVSARRNVPIHETIVSLDEVTKSVRMTNFCRASGNRSLLWPGDKSPKNISAKTCSHVRIMASRPSHIRLSRPSPSRVSSIEMNEVHSPGGLVRCD